MGYKAAIFDLDGVIVDTARFHYSAWKEIAEKYGKDFTQRQNERLKGVSRRHSLEILLEECGLILPEEEQEFLLEYKNKSYVSMLDTLSEKDILPGVKDFLTKLREYNIKTALGSASRNATYILEKLKLVQEFDEIVDGNKTSRAKPDPEVFRLGSESLGIKPQECVVFEDAQSGVAAAKAGGMGCIGIGCSTVLQQADFVVKDLQNWQELLVLFEKGMGD